MEQALTTSVITTTDPLSRELPLFIKSLNKWAHRHDIAPVELLIADDFGAWGGLRRALSADDADRLSVRVLTTPGRVGQLAAMQAAFMATTTDRILLADPDQSHCIPALGELFDELDAGALIAHGVRSQRPELGPVRLLGSHLANLACRQLLGLSIQDINSPFFAVSGAGRQLVAEMPGDISNARLYLMASQPHKVSTVSLPPGGGLSPSHYSTSALIRLMAGQLRECLRIRSALARSANQ